MIESAGNLTTTSPLLLRDKAAVIVILPPGIEIFATAKSEPVAWIIWKDLASPGLFDWDLQTEPASLIFFAEDFSNIGNEDGSTVEIANKLRAQELERREAFSTPLSAAADSYLVKRSSGKTIIAGYPWFGDWGRDTFISLRGLCLATDRLETARGYSWSNGPAPFRGGCYRIVFRTAAFSRNSIRSTRRCGTSSLSLNISTTPEGNRNWKTAL